jgi:hypothetical protein
MADSAHWLSRAWHSVWGTLHADAGEDPLRQKARQTTHTGTGLLLIVTEPEGQDFWLQPGETVELRAEVESEADDFELIEGDAEITVWPSPGMGCISVWRHGQQLQCGYQRPTESSEPVSPSAYGALR